MKADRVLRFLFNTEAVILVILIVLIFLEVIGVPVIDLKETASLVLVWSALSVLLFLSGLFFISLKIKAVRKKRCPGGGEEKNQAGKNKFHILMNILFSVFYILLTQICLFMLIVF